MMRKPTPLIYGMLSVLLLLWLVVACTTQGPPSRMEAHTATRAQRFVEANPTVGVATPEDGAARTPIAIGPTAPVTPVLIPTAVPPTVAPPTAASPTAPPSYQPAASRVELTGFNHEWQTWNNCGPATLAMNLSYFGSPLTQADIGAVLRRHEDDKNVGPEELVAYAASQGYHAQMRVNGDRDLMRLLLSNGIPVLIETWLEEDPNDGMGHYRLLTGYDDAEQYWIAHDSYVDTGLFSSLRSYRGIRLDYAATEQLWSVFNHTYLLIYTDAQTAKSRLESSCRSCQ